ncbi:Initiation-specific alpha-1-6-mannosyltransferase [Apiospora kogelbergensis]|uniref:Initiation-specific alpha-1-6-mannosyltransferase n=1 Tax=Apiospora kogelbergensis TaxID=1337665 RepID=UPI00313105CB
MIGRSLFSARVFCLALSLLFLAIYFLVLLRPDSVPSAADFEEVFRYREKHVATASPDLIPQKIWQIFLTPRDVSTGHTGGIDHEKLGDTASWIAMNPDHQYTLMSLNAADRFVKTNFASNWTVRRIYQQLRNPGLKSDLLRYLILSVEGGVYTDTDTECFQPIDRWFRGRARVVVGIEFDKLDGPNWVDIPHDLQFCQWTIAAAPGHPLFTRMVERAITSLKATASEHSTTVAALQATSFETMNSTGPAAFTDVVFEMIQLADPSVQSLRDLSGMAEPRLYGDILVLPIDGFGMGQPHSHSTNDGSVPPGAMLRHNFRGSWRAPS